MFVDAVVFKRLMRDRQDLRDQARAAGRYKARAEYVDAAAFTKLFRHRRKNHARICAGMLTIARGVAARFWFRNVDDRDEAVAVATLAAVDAVDEFSFSRGGNAFSYFSSVTYNAIWHHVAAEKRRRARCGTFTEISTQYRWGPQASPHRGIPYARI